MLRLLAFVVFWGVWGPGFAHGLPCQTVCVQQRTTPTCTTRCAKTCTLEQNPKDPGGYSCRYPNGADSCCVLGERTVCVKQESRCPSGMVCRDKACVAPACGDGKCEAPETCRSCAKDCGECQGSCGDDRCELSKGESCRSCEEDCGACLPVCGDGVCQAAESPADCPADCSGPSSESPVVLEQPTRADGGAPKEQTAATGCHLARSPAGFGWLLLFLLSSGAFRARRE